MGGGGGKEFLWIAWFNGSIIAVPIENELPIRGIIRILKKPVEKSGKFCRDIINPLPPSLPPPPTSPWYLKNKKGQCNKRKISSGYKFNHSADFQNRLCVRFICLATSISWVSDEFKPLRTCCLLFFFSLGKE